MPPRVVVPFLLQQGCQSSARCVDVLMPLPATFAAEVPHWCCSSHPSEGGGIKYSEVRIRLGAVSRYDFFGVHASGSST
jgi:hypothetical protein